VIEDTRWQAVFLNIDWGKDWEPVHPPKRGKVTTVALTGMRASLPEKEKGAREGGLVNGKEESAKEEKTAGVEGSYSEVGYVSGEERGEMWVSIRFTNSFGREDNQKKAK